MSGVIETFPKQANFFVTRWGYVSQWSVETNEGTCGQSGEHHRTWHVTELSSDRMRRDLN